MAFGFGLVLLFLLESNALSATYQVSVSGNRLTADIKNVPLSAVIADIGAKTGIRFIFLGGAGAAGYNAPFSLKNESLPIRTALEKLLSGFNYSLISDGDDNIRQVFILGAKSASKTAPATQPPFSMAARSGQTVRPVPAGNPPGQEGMQIGPGEDMQIGPGEGMQVAPGAGMQIGPPSGNPPEGMEIRSQGVGAPPEGMQVGPDSPEGMNAAPASTEGVAAQSSGAQDDVRKPVRRPSRWGFRKK